MNIPWNHFMFTACIRSYSSLNHKFEFELDFHIRSRLKVFKRWKCEKATSSDLETSRYFFFIENIWEYFRFAQALFLFNRLALLSYRLKNKKTLSLLSPWHCRYFSCESSLHWWFIRRGNCISLKLKIKRKTLRKKEKKESGVIARAPSWGSSIIDEWREQVFI